MYCRLAVNTQLLARVSHLLKVCSTSSRHSELEMAINIFLRLKIWK